jgi:hypothetical protein
MAYTTINKSTDYFNTKLYTGNGGTQSITGVGFQPDWVWIKNRNAAENHSKYDIVRGANKVIYSNSTAAENTETNGVSSFDSDGFSVGNNGSVNGSSQGQVAWNWKANGTGSANTAGSINSTVSVNTTAGFSIVSYTGNATTGATIGHGLGVTPDLIIAKSRVASDNWGFFHSSFSSQQYMFLNTTAAVASASSVWNALPSSSVFTVGDNESVNDNGNMIAYCFAEKTGYSKFGSYTGNGNNDGSFIYTGFKPAFVMTKCTSNSGEPWLIQDSKRIGYNGITYGLLANSSAVEASETYHEIDFLSNGFKWRGNDTRVNANNYSYIYMAFGQSIVGSNNIPATAR